MEEVSKGRKQKQEDTLMNCLRNERIVIRHINTNSKVTNPKHVLYGNMAETAYKYFCVPKYQSGIFVNVLTNAEKEYLEDAMGLEYNALSVYKKIDNYWENRMVRLGKADNYLDLSIPEQYIDYKILLANTDFIAPSLKELEERPKATYQFVIISNNEEVNAAKNEMTTIMKAYMEFGRIKDNIDDLRCLIEIIEKRPLSPTVKIETLQTKTNTLIQAGPKKFVTVVTDKLFPVKVLIKKAVLNGIISNRAGLFFMQKDNIPLCNSNEDPTLDVAASYLAQPNHQDLKFSIEATLNKK